LGKKVFGFSKIDINLLSIIIKKDEKQWNN
jgi:hypothetical protein